MALQKGIKIHQYLADWLVRARSLQTCLKHTQTIVALCQDLGWLVNMEKSELDPKQVFEFVGYQFDLKEGKVRPTLDHYADTDNQNQIIINWTHLSGLVTHVPHRAFDSNRKTGPPRWTTYEAHTESLEKGDTSNQVAPHPSRMVAVGKQYAPRSTITPTKTCPAAVYRCLKRSLGSSLKRSHCKGNLVPSRKKTTHKLPGTKGGIVGPKRDNTPVVAYINKEGGMKSGPLCALFLRILTWCTSKQFTL